jgi:hypothetical protein
MLDAQQEGRVLPAEALHLVESIAGHTGDARIEADPGAHSGQGRERAEVLIEELVAGRMDLGIRPKPPTIDQ